MTATYDITTNVGKVRLIIGDTDVHPESDAVFTDEELGYFLTNNSNNINLAAADALEAWMAKYATSPDSEKIGDYAYTQKATDNMLVLAGKLKASAAMIPAQDWSTMDLQDTLLETNE